jgi:hypothetical protein
MVREGNYLHSLHPGVRLLPQPAASAQTVPGGIAALVVGRAVRLLVEGRVDGLAPIIGFFG